jgi:UDP-2-acetamido-3-amino-2,3-dideoxy-glucuronate N-acetyltransferase
VIDPTARIHASADVEADVAVGPRTALWHGAHIRRGARIGADCIVGGGAYIDEDVAIGDRVKIQNHALVYHGTTVEDGVFIGPGAILTNDRNPRAITTTGDVATAADWTVSPILLRHGCSIGAGAVVVAGTTVGRYAMVAAGAVAAADVPGHALVAGVPARRVGWVCACGVRLVDSSGNPAPAEPAHYARDTDLTCPSCGRAWGYVPDEDTLAERTPRVTTKQGAPA